MKLSINHSFGEAVIREFQSTVFEGTPRYTHSQMRSTIFCGCVAKRLVFEFNGCKAAVRTGVTHNRLSLVIELNRRLEGPVAMLILPNQDEQKINRGIR